MVASEYVVTNLENKKLSVIIEIGLPELDGGDFRCRLSVLALGVDEYVYGVDAIQSYCLVLNRLKMLFNKWTQEGLKFHFPGHTDMQIDFLNSYFETQT